ncbi:alpha-L-fucosidase [Nibricoccus sp. IMCC34717]|uniref:alpha-L-fucosidase n=1 Tax=Nibricoccus sp. IMCC34717 TaxID=3034021 RepID=UPI00384D23C1
MPLALRPHLVSALLALAAIAPVSLPAQADTEVKRYAPSWESLDKRPMPAWYLDAKFGVFIHWGVYSVPAWGTQKYYAEWYWQRIKSPDPEHREWADFHAKNFGADFDYKDFAPRFRAELFNADQWADLFQRAGIRYVVPTSKHHEGFALWPSAEASRTWGRPWNAVEIGPKRDVLGELAEATRRKGIKFGFYYSLYEWFNPLWLTDRDRYVREHMIPQFKDVVTRYKPAIIFSDGEWDMPSTQWRSEELLAWLFNDAPSRAEVVVNDRWGSETRHKHGGYWTTEYAAGLKDDSHPWEESRGMAYSYGYNRAERIDDYKSSRELIFILIDLVSRGGNLLLDIGPAADGTIPPIMEERLLQIGEWLRANGEAIYGTRFAGRPCQWTAGEHQEQKLGEYQVTYSILDQVGQSPREGRAVKQVFFTRKGEDLYAITAGWPGAKLVLRDVTCQSNVPEVTLLATGRQLEAKRNGGDLEILLGDFVPSENSCAPAYAIRIRGASLR